VTYLTMGWLSLIVVYQLAVKLAVGGVTLLAVGGVSGLADVKIDRQEVTHAAAEHEAVPDSVVIGNTFI
jgi:hypothetical protein